MLNAPNWDALAPYWHCFENVGLNKTIASILKPHLVLPVLYVGGGRGTYPAYLRTWIGQENLFVVDSSSLMAQRAYVDFNLKYIVADARDLPLPDKSFGSVVCATGVLEFLDLSEQKKALREMARVCSQAGSLLVTTFYCDRPNSESPTQSSRCDCLPVDQNHDLLDRWFQCQSSLSQAEQRIVASFSIVAREMGDRTAAYELLRSSLSVNTGFVNLKTFQRTVNEAGLNCELLKVFVERDVAVWRLS